MGYGGVVFLLVFSFSSMAFMGRVGKSVDFCFCCFLRACVVGLSFPVRFVLRFLEAIFIFISLFYFLVISSVQGASGVLFSFFFFQWVSTLKWAFFQLRFSNGWMGMFFMVRCFTEPNEDEMTIRSQSMRTTNSNSISLSEQKN
jgi:hypothetical protein